MSIAQSGVYVDGIRHAINKLHAIGNAYIYLDIARSSLGGYESVFAPAVSLYTSLINGTTAGSATIDGTTATHFRASASGSNSGQMSHIYSHAAEAESKLSNTMGR